MPERFGVIGKHLDGYARRIPLSWWIGPSLDWPGSGSRCIPAPETIHVSIVERTSVAFCCSISSDRHYEQYRPSSAIMTHALRIHPSGVGAGPAPPSTVHRPPSTVHRPALDLELELESSSELA
jgi:hypothetical protein